MTAENKDSTKAGEPTPDEIKELTPEELGQVIEAEDPEFASQLESLKGENLEIPGDNDLLPDNLPLSDIAHKEPLKVRIRVALRKFKFWPFYRKLILFGVVFAIPGLGYYFVYIFKKGLIHPRTQIYVNSLEEWADHKYSWDPSADDEKEVFYGSLHLPLYVYSMNKLIVNLKTSSYSPSNAMIAVELVAEGTSPEVVAELKEKESYYRDIFQQQLSQMSYENVSETSGKERMLEQLRRTANETLAQGKIKKLYIKNIILKN